MTALGTWLENRGLLANDRMTRVMVYQPHGASASLQPVLCGDEHAYHCAQCTIPRCYHR